MTPSARRGSLARVEVPSRTELYVDRRFLPLADRFFAMYRQPQQGGGALVVYLGGEKVLDIWAGNADRDRRWDHDTVSLSFSTGKGVASTVVHRLAERGLIDYDAPVARYWPEFAAAGKDKITVRELMSHRAGLHRVRGLMPHPLDLMDYDAVVAALAAEKPDPRRLRGPGYHAVTYGWLVAELVARVSGQPFIDVVQAGDSEAPRSRRILVPRTRNRASTDREAVPTYQPCRLELGLRVDRALTRRSDSRTRGGRDAGRFRRHGAQPGCPRRRHAGLERSVQRACSREDVRRHRERRRDRREAVPEGIDHRPDVDHPDSRSGLRAGGAAQLDSRLPPADHCRAAAAAECDRPLRSRRFRRVCGPVQRTLARFHHQQVG